MQIVHTVSGRVQNYMGKGEQEDHDGPILLTWVLNITG